MKNEDNTDEKVPVSFSLTRKTRDILLNICESEMGGNKSKWLERELQKIFESRQQKSTA